MKKWSDSTHAHRSSGAWRKFEGFLSEFSSNWKTQVSAAILGILEQVAIEECEKFRMIR